MDHARGPAATATPSAGLSQLRRFVSRRPTLTAVTLALAGLGLTFKYISTTIRQNELAQKQSARSSFYVPVERSGGGI
ncbi:hypothetical protein QBC37DRAFT_120649 [Rhypophila decipiens]|uniref:Uncharacterized protein n=1 Tax=Rhypophila decipiens TaxID=261697 RepID=A0AAN6YAI3_9PEZI|nr:hypothetical protein QBC37DRAFT_120649 [Rhypophila decipiens]